MSTLLQIQSAYKSFGARELFRDAAFAVNEGEHLGVIGPNGAGKTTLFKVLVGEEHLDSGEVTRSKDLRLGYLAQHDLWAPEETVEDYLLGTGAGGPKLPVLTPIWDLKSLGRKLGLTDERFSAPMRSLSGGYRMRVKLLRLIGQQPNLMMLDEPTNYLDLETLLVLEDFLLDYKGAFLLISHDREFLRRTTDHILEVEAGDMTKFPGTIDDYFEQKEMLRSQLEARAMSLDARRQEVLDFAARFGAKASKARQVQSRLKSLGRMETIELKPLPVRAKIRLPAPARVAKLATRIENGEVGFGERVILRQLNIELEGGDHVGVVGLNGAGKTTLLRTIAGELPLRQGKSEQGYQVSVGYYGQMVPERLNPAQTVRQALQSVADFDTTPQDILDLAASLLFQGDDVQKKISVLSGGEKSRVALGQVLLQKASLLLLDEPTNHLDFYTVEALTQALHDYPGTVVVVSHDRGFIRRVATKILEVRDGCASLYPGSYDDYVWSLEKGVLQRGKGGAGKAELAASAGAVGTVTGAGTLRFVGVPEVEAPKVNFKERRSALDKRQRQINKRLEEIPLRLEKLQAAMNAHNEKLLASKGDEAAKAVKELAETQQESDALESEWMQLAEELEGIQGELKDMGVVK